MQLVAYGAQDIYLTGNPQITFFKVVYRRHTNFSMEAIQQTINGTSTIGTAASTGTVTISRNGDLVSKLYVRCDQDTANGINGDKLISEVELEIGGQRIDRHYEEWNQVWAELTTPESKAAGYKYLTGGFTNSLVSGAGTNQQSIMVPLQFWFCRNPGLALPLIALQYHEVKLKFTWGIDTNVGRDGSAATPTCEVWADYIYLDTDERRRFAQVSHEYLIEQIQREAVDADKTSLKLNFNHPVKELIWTSGANTAWTTQKCKLQLNGHDRFADQDREYFQVRQPLDCHTAVPGFNVKELEAPVLSSNPVIFAANAAALDTADNAATLEITGTAGGATIELGSNFVGTIVGQTSVKVGDILQVVNSIDGSSSADDTEYYQGRVKSVTAGTNALTIVVTFDDAGTAAITTTDTTTVDSRVSVIRVGRSQNPLSRCSQLAKDVNVYSFALKPEEHQPSGTCNFSRIDNAQLVFDGTTGVDKVYAVNYNVLRIMSGMGGLAYSN
jgi:hypothetical protein